MKAGKISYPGVGVAVGGVLGILGGLLTWFSFSYAVGGQTVTVNLSASQDWTGAVALAASFGALAFGGAYVLFDDPKIRRLTSILMSVCAAFVLVMPLFGLARLKDVAVPGASTDWGAGLAISFVGGIFAMVGAFLASREKAGPAAAPVEAAEPQGTEEAATTA